MTIKKNTILVLLATTLFFGCSEKQDLVSLYDMECTQLLAQEVKAQEKYRSMNTEKIADLVLDVLDNSDKAVTSASQSGLDANEAKQELRDIQQAIHSKKCK